MEMVNLTDLEGTHNGAAMSPSPSKKKATTAAAGTVSPWKTAFPLLLDILL